MEGRCGGDGGGGKAEGMEGEKMEGRSGGDGGRSGGRERGVKGCSTKVKEGRNNEIYHVKSRYFHVKVYFLLHHYTFSA